MLIEPTRGVDVGARADIYRRLDALARAGKAIVLVSSDLPEVLRLPTASWSCATARSPPRRTPGDIDEERLNLLVQGAGAHDGAGDA